MNKTAYIYKIEQKQVGDKHETRLLGLDTVKVNTTESSPKTQVFKDTSPLNGSVIWTVMLYYEDMTDEMRGILNMIMLPAAKALEQFVLENAEKQLFIDHPFSIPSAKHDK